MMVRKFPKMAGRTSFAERRQTIQSPFLVTHSKKDDQAQHSPFLFRKHFKDAHGALPSSKFLAPALSPKVAAAVGPALPILDDIYTDLTEGRQPPDFSRTLFICGQHLLNTTVSLFELYIKLGAKPENMYVVGKSYSNNAEVIKQIQGLGIHVQLNREQDQLGEFTPRYEADIREMLWRIVGRLEKEEPFRLSTDSIVALDDGGHVLTEIKHNKELMALCKRYYRIVGIEQTSSGIPSAQSTPFPVIELATSCVKRDMEPAMIAQRVGENVVCRLKKIPSLYRKTENRVLHDFIKSEKEVEDASSAVLSLIQSVTGVSDPTCTIIGAGYIGRAVLEELIRNGVKKIFILDQDVVKAREVANLYREKSVSLGKPITISAEVSLPVAVLESELVAGCTGTDITSDQQVIEAFERRTRNTIFFSCGSKDITGAMLLKYIQARYVGRNVSVPSLDDRCFTNKEGATILLLRGLFPLNFDNSPASVPPHAIQLIRGLTAMATVQAYNIMAQSPLPLLPENYQLDAEAQKRVVELFAKHQPELFASYSDGMQKKLHDSKAIAAESGGKLYLLSCLEKNILPPSPMAISQEDGGGLCYRRP